MYRVVTLRGKHNFLRFAGFLFFLFFKIRNINIISSHSIIYSHSIVLRARLSRFVVIYSLNFKGAELMSFTDGSDKLVELGVHSSGFDRLWGVGVLAPPSRTILSGID